jgi:hypothetical protein
VQEVATIDRYLSAVVAIKLQSDESIVTPEFWVEIANSAEARNPLSPTINVDSFEVDRRRKY